MKKFTHNDHVISAYLDQSFLSGMNYRDSLSFRGTYLYSYNSHLATLDIPNKVVLIDKYICRYSVTTSKHTTLLFNQVPSDFTMYPINLSAKPEQNLIEYWKDIEERIVKFNRARTVQSKESHKYHVQEFLTEALAYAEYTSIDKRTKAWKYHAQITKQLFQHKLL